MAFPNTTSRRIEDMNLSRRMTNCLHGAGILTLSELLVKTESQLMQIRGFGRYSLILVQRKLQSMGLCLKEGQGQSPDRTKTNGATAHPYDQPIRPHPHGLHCIVCGGDLGASDEDVGESSKRLRCNACVQEGNHLSSDIRFCRYCGESYSFEEYLRSVSGWEKSRSTQSQLRGSFSASATCAKCRLNYVIGGKNAKIRRNAIAGW